MRTTHKRCIHNAVQRIILPINTHAHTHLLLKSLILAGQAKQLLTEGIRLLLMGPQLLLQLLVLRR